MLTNPPLASALLGCSDRDHYLAHAQQAAEHAKVNPITLRRAVKAGMLPAYRVNGGRLLRFRASDIDQWLVAAPVMEKSHDARTKAPCETT